MTFEEYQKESRKTAKHPESIPRHLYTALGMAGEAGEIINQIKKIHRDDNDELTEERKKSIKKELGDILWYVTNLATDLDLDMEDVAKTNLDKLFSRMDRGKIFGDGDER